MIWWQISLVVIVSYFIGNLSFARYISKAMKSDVTKLGSGNPGSTNMLRNFGFKVGFLTFILDIIKGFLPTFLAWLIFKDTFIMYLAGICAIVGHIYPMLYKFKGGKGIATMMGVFLAADPFVAFIVILIAALCWICFKYGSVASFTCVTAMTVIEGIKAKNSLPIESSKFVCLELFIIFLLTWYAHRGNIQRLLVGKESKVNLLKSAKKKYKKM